MMNSVQLVGILEKKNDLRTTKIGGAVMNFVLKVPNKIIAKEGLHYSYVLCTAFNKSAQMVNDYAEIGMMIQVLGSIHESIKNIKGLKIRTFFIVCDKVAIYQDIGASSENIADYKLDDLKNPIELNASALDSNENDK